MTSPYRLVPLTSKQDCLAHTKHAGWCTGKTDNDHYERVYSRGKLYCIYKPGKRRPSYQLYISPYDSVEFRRTGNKSMDVWELVKQDKALKACIGHILPKKKPSVSYVSTPTSNHSFIEEYLHQFSERPVFLRLDMARAPDHQGEITFRINNPVNDVVTLEEEIRWLIDTNQWITHEEKGRVVGVAISEYRYRELQHYKYSLI